MIDRYKWDTWVRNDGREHLAGFEGNIFYLGNYYSGVGFKGGPLNNDINNFKKGRNVSDQVAYYRNRAIMKLSGNLSDTRSLVEQEGSLITWIPPSKMKGHPSYDDRFEILTARSFNPLYVAELVERTVDLDPLHLQRGPRYPSRTYNSLRFVGPQGLNLRQVIILDDLVTSGSSFLGTAMRIREIYPDVKIIGMFLGLVVERQLN